MKALLDNLSSEAFWLRLVFMLLFALVAEVAIPLMLILILVQFVYRLFSGKCQEDIFAFTSSLTKFIFHIYRFLSYQTEDKPFPFADWPSPQPRQQPQQDD